MEKRDEAQAVARGIGVGGRGNRNEEKGYKKRILILKTCWIGLMSHLSLA